MDIGFVRFREKNFRKIWISDFTGGNTFSPISCTVFESNKKRKPFGRFRYTVCNRISLKFSNVKKLGVNFLRDILLEGVCVHGI